MKEIAVSTSTIDFDQMLEEMKNESSDTGGDNASSDTGGDNANSNLLVLPSTEVLPSDARPNIILTDRQQREILEDCDKVILDSTKPTLYRIGDSLISIIKDADGSEQTKKLTSNNLLKYLTTQANFWKKSTGKISSCVPTNLPKRIADMLLDNLNPRIPEVQMISSHPLLTHDGTLHFNPGYNSKAKAFICQRGGYMEDLPTREEAVNILSDVFCDFPFESDGDYANLIAALLQQIVRLSIDSATRLYQLPLILVQEPRFTC
jgi:hypothetical protein